MLTIYKASAGSGKTFTLSATFIAHLIGEGTDNAHKHQLAVTFTNKATAEMKERILQNLYTLAFGKDDADGFFKAVKAELPAEISTAEIRRRARTALYALIHDYDQFHVRTIDSFFQSLLANLAHEVGFSTSFKVEIDDKNILSKAVDRFLEGVKEDSDELEWLMSFVAQRLENDVSWNVSEELRTLSAELLKEKYMKRRHLLHRRELSEEELVTYPESIDLTNTVVDNYRKTLREKERNTRQQLAKKARQTDETIRSTIGYERISNGTRWVEPPIRAVADENIPYGKLKGFSASFRAFASGEKEMLKAADRKKNEICQQSQMVKEYMQRLVDNFDKSGYDLNSCALSLANIYPLRLLDSIDHEVEELNRENDRFMLAYTPLLFDKLTGNTDTSFVFERAGTQFQHVMIDEFQDTSPLQWKNMHHLLVENMAQGNSCMLVGDVKQGIYRFRGGDWNTLADFREESVDGEKIVDIKTLKRNFRSGKEIVAFNNRIFTAAPAAVDDWLATDRGITPDQLPPSQSACRIYPIPDPQNDPHEVTQIAVNEGGYVRVEFLDSAEENGKGKRKKGNVEAPETEESEEKEKVEDLLAAQIERLHDCGIPYEEMAILVRNNRDTTRILRHFEISYPEVPMVSEEAFLLDASPAVQTIIHALKYVENRTDNIAREYVLNRLEESEKPAVMQMLDRWHSEHYGGLPFYEIVTKLMEVLHLDRMEGQSPYLYCFLDTMLKHIDENTSDIREFLRTWEERLHRTALPSAAVKGVRIITIHKSKGLAFHTVLLPYNDWVIDDAKKPERVWTLPKGEPYNAIPLLPVVLNASAGNSIYSDIYREEQYNRFVESLNIMYVAFTRAKQNLLVWGKPGKGEKAVNVAYFLREAMKATGMIQPAENEDEGTDSTVHTVEFGSPSVLGIKASAKDDSGRAAEAPKKKEKNPLDFRAQVKNMEYRVSACVPNFRQSQSARLFIEMERGLGEELPAASDNAEKARREEFRQTGILLHELMSAIATADDVEGQVANFVREGRLPAGKRAESLIRLIRQRMNHPTARGWFDGSWTLYREATLIFRDEQGQMLSRRPDRVMKRGVETVVIDFKFGRPKPEYTEQVRQYIRLLRRQSASLVKAYLWYLYTGEIVEVRL